MLAFVGALPYRCATHWRLQTPHFQPQPYALCTSAIGSSTQRDFVHHPPPSPILPLPSATGATSQRSSCPRSWKSSHLLSRARSLLPRPSSPILLINRPRRRRSRRLRRLRPQPQKRQPRTPNANEMPPPKSGHNRSLRAMDPRSRRR